MWMLSILLWCTNIHDYFSKSSLDIIDILCVCVCVWWAALSGMTARTLGMRDSISAIAEAKEMVMNITWDNHALSRVESHRCFSLSRRK